MIKVQQSRIETAQKLKAKNFTELATSKDSYSSSCTVGVVCRGLKGLKVSRVVHLVGKSVRVTVWSAAVIGKTT
jgi:hypothetical protein